MTQVKVRYVCNCRHNLTRLPQNPLFGGTGGGGGGGTGGGVALDQNSEARCTMIAIMKLKCRRESCLDFQTIVLRFLLVSSV